MATLSITNAATENVRRSVATVSDVNQVFVSASPGSGAGWREQAQDVLDAVASVLRAEGAWDSLVHQTVFLADIKLAAPCRELFRRYFGGRLPATSYILQPPCDGKLLALETHGIGASRAPFQIERVNERLVIARHNGIDWVYATQALPRTSAAGIYEKATCCFHSLRRLLPSGGVGFNQVVRTWLHLGGIVDDDGPMQNYKELNRARTDFFEGIPFLSDRLPVDYGRPVYPASTGIGTDGRGINMSALAVATERTDLYAVPLENPRQTAAYDYASSYSPQSPKFSRAMTLVHGADSTIFISGTASITHSETRHIGDAVGQTHETLDNISALISEENHARHGLPGRGTTLEGLGVIRVYVKNASDYADIRAVCQKRLGSLPMTFVVADVCRPDLLVEIEGIAFASLAAGVQSPLPQEQPRRFQVESSDRKDLLSSPWRGHVPSCPDGCPERLVCPHAVLK